MLDPKTLKVDDVVIFGDSVELTVSDNETIQGFSSVWFYDGGDETMINRNSPLWKSAKIKRAPLPNKLAFGFTLTKEGNYKYNSVVRTPSQMLVTLTRDAVNLLKAGVETVK